MASLPGSGQWNVANPKGFWKDNPPFSSLSLDFDNNTGQCEVLWSKGDQISPLTNLLALSPTKFGASYTFGVNKGTIEGEIDDHMRIDLTFRGSVSTSCMAEPIKTRTPRVVSEALRALDRESQQFSVASIDDAATKREYAANIKKFNQAILSDVKKGKLTKDEAVKTIAMIRGAISGFLASRWLTNLKSASGEATTAASHVWGQHGTMTIREAFGNLDLPDDAWVHFEASANYSKLVTDGVTTRSKSSWCRWGEVKSMRQGDLVWKMGPMSTFAESDVGTMVVAPKDAVITPVKSSGGFEIEGEATGTVKNLQVMKSSSVQALAKAEQEAGVSIAALEEAYAVKKFAEAAKRPTPKGKSTRLFDKLTKGEQSQVRLEIIESTMPGETKMPATSGKWGKIGKCLMVVSIGISIYKIATAEEKLKQASREVTGFGSGMAAGAAFGTAVSTVAPEASPVIIGLSSFIGGILGALGADYVFDWVESLGTQEEEY